MTNAVNIAQSGSNNVTFRNRIINGAMVIDQRNAGASVSVNPSNTLYMCVDRWYGYAYPSGTTGAYTLQQKSDTPPANFSNYLRATVTTARTLTSTDYFAIEQRIEGYNIADLACGTSNAKSFTVSFWVRSNLIGQYSVSSYGSSAGLPIAYTINQANTWEYKTLTFPSVTSATFSASSTTNGQGMVLVWALGMPSSYSGASGTLGSNFWAATGNVNLMATVGNTIDITGVQLEAGTTASPFEYRQYGTELALCQRYYCKSYQQSVAPATSTTLGVTGVIASTASLLVGGFNTWPVTMRTTPTVTIYSQIGTSGKLSAPGAVDTGTTVISETPSEKGAVGINSAGGFTIGSWYYGHFVATAEL